jgi:antitoxin ParD1/3/4
MSDIERLTITLPTDMAALLKGAVSDGDYASTSEVVREAIRDWKMKRTLQMQALAALQADIDKGMADIVAGRTKSFSKDHIIKQGRKRLVRPTPSA